MKKAKLNSYLLEKCIIGNGIINGILNAIIFYFMEKNIQMLYLQLEKNYLLQLLFYVVLIRFNKIMINLKILDL